MAIRTTYLTLEGRSKLQAELDNLITERRPQIARRLQLAREDGDVSDNGAFEDAQHEQALVEARIRDVQFALSTANLVDTPTGPSDTVAIGSTVTIREGRRDKETYRIVGVAESDARRGFISNESPVGRALLGQACGAEVHLLTPGGARAVKILSIA